MIESNSERMDKIKETASIAIAQANLSDQLAQLIWRATPSDISLGLVESSEEIMSNLLGSETKEPKEETKEATIVSYLNEVERAVYGDKDGHPENGSVNHFKAAENYAVAGDRFLDFPQDLSSCFSNLSTDGNSVVSLPIAATNPPPGFDRPARSALYQRRHSQQPSTSTAAAAGCSSNYANANNSPPKGGYNNLSPQRQQQFQRQPPNQSPRQGAGSESAHMANQNASNVNVNDNSSSVQYPKWSYTDSDTRQGTISAG
ncbi:uncharacterized protein Dwil_GK14946 [Drosophila willistoni]|uniref:Uncharacterized protein n=1 Tax=Drosophila willistoni TaxID=7260 RepID=B4MW52_DROWI|nr:uncharacterized protein Dwil_GK14946 [Drosophila willistoni]